MNFKFVGREGYYREGELYLLGQRWYDSSVGRFISRDPIGEKGGLNLYVYGENNSLKFYDPLGFQSIPYPTPVICTPPAVLICGIVAGIVICYCSIKEPPSPPCFLESSYEIEIKDDKGCPKKIYVCHYKCFKPWGGVFHIIESSDVPCSYLKTVPIP